MPEKSKTNVMDDEGNDLITQDTNTAQDVDDLLTSIGTRGLDVLEEPRAPYSALEHGIAKESDEVELDLTPGAADAATDPVRVYLREMGASPLLTREQEVEIAKRIERGQLSKLKALSRSPIVILQVLAIGHDLKSGLRSIKDTVVFDEEEVTEEILENRVEDVTEASTNWTSTTRQPAASPKSWRPFRRKRKPGNTCAADTGWGVRWFGFRWSSGTSASTTRNKSAWPSG